VPQALIYLPLPTDAADGDHAQRCIAYCDRCGYTTAHIVRGDWPAAFQLLCDGTVDVLVVADAGHLDSCRLPRVEVVSDYEPGPGVSPARGRRPRPV
jgi:hypothetical protein